MRCSFYLRYIHSSNFSNIHWNAQRMVQLQMLFLFQRGIFSFHASALKKQASYPSCPFLSQACWLIRIQQIYLYLSICKFFLISELFLKVPKSWRIFPWKFSHASNLVHYLGAIFRGISPLRRFPPPSWSCAQLGPWGPGSHILSQKTRPPSRWVASPLVSFFYTPPKTNMAPKNGGLEDDFPFQTGDFQVRC